MNPSKIKTELFITLPALYFITNLHFVIGSSEIKMFRLIDRQREPE